MFAYFRNPITVWILVSLILLLGVAAVFSTSPVQGQSQPPIDLWSPANTQAAVPVPVNLAWCPVDDNHVSQCSRIINAINTLAEYYVYICEGVGCTPQLFTVITASAICSQSSNICIWQYPETKGLTTYQWQILADDVSAVFESEIWRFTTADATPDVSVSVSPAFISASSGDLPNYTVTAQSLNGLTGTVNFTVSGCPAGATCGYLPVSASCNLSSGGSCIMDLIVTNVSSAAPGTYTLNLLAQHVGSSANDTAQAVLEIIQPADLQIGPASTWPNTGSQDAAINFTFTTQNTGGTEANGFQDALYVDGPQDSGFVQVAATASNRVVPPGGSNTTGLSWTPGVCGTFLIEVRTDVNNVISESNENNNTGPSPVHTLTVDCPPPPPDFELTDISWTPVSPNTSDTVSFTATVTNSGGSASEADLVECRLGSATGTLIGFSSLVPLNPGQTATVPCGSTSFSTAGNQTIYAVALNVPNETVTSNNSRTETLTVDSPPPVCGDGNIDPGEQCDGSNLNGQTCQSQGFPAGGNLNCSASCTYDTSQCVASICGNGLIEDSEQCDGSNLNGQTCQSQGFDGGTLSCSSSCTFDTVQCTTFACGNSVIDPGEQCDGTNLGGETCQSQGFDSGTLSCSSCSLDTSNCATTPLPDELVGDLNCDGVVNVKDLGIILSTQWWSSVAGGYTGGYNHPSCP